MLGNIYDNSISELYNILNRINSTSHTSRFWLRLSVLNLEYSSVFVFFLEADTFARVHNLKLHVHECRILAEVYIDELREISRLR